jgi:hypothetical protein
LFTVLGKGIEPDKAKDDKQLRPEFVWYPLSGDPTKPGLWLAIARVHVDVNTMNRITVRYINPRAPTAKEKEDGSLPEECVESSSGSEDDSKNYNKDYKGNFLATNAFFSNSPDSPVTVSIALGMTFNTHDTSVSSGGSNQHVNGYAFAKYYFRNPRLSAGPGEPRYRTSWGAVVGTNVVHDALDELILGLSAGHLVGHMGFIAGINLIRPSQGSDRGRRARPFFGLEYSF